ncbi:MAG TPA: 1-acyl-sn-glycerol-3-phosphate acyltransferase [Leptospiraceae bacterium]|nr:1-acyl-sn-glycerol-3-phosphate acyltransferase [Leptospiraceae bacterium]HNN04535.1 1-acyl-sn-glycerol-3-phosphate acyltransferase [Leptospiraceae bacterium]
MPPVMNVFKEPDSLEKTGVYTEMNETSRAFMIKFLNPIMRNFKVEGLENLALIEKLIGKFPMTLISNHLSHLDAPGIFHLLYTSGETGRRIAEQITFIAGRLAFEPDFTRLGLYMFGTLLVCSKKDMSDNPSLSDMMTKINMRAFRQSQKLQSEGKIISIFPEGTRSRDGRLMPFVDTVFHYVSNKVVIPISLEGTDKILPTTGFLFNAAVGKLVIGKPVIVGDLKNKAKVPEFDLLEKITPPEKGDKKQFLIDNLALLVGSNLSKHKHGSYRNLYSADKSIRENTLIQIPKSPEENIVVIGSSYRSIAAAAILANKNVMVTVYTPDKEMAENCNTEQRDLEHFPLFKLPPNVRFSADPDVILKATMFVQGANPWQFENVYAKIKDNLKKNKSVILNVVKGFSSSRKGLIMYDLEDMGVEKNRLAVAAGAGYPEQMMERKISGLEVAAIDTSQIPRLVSLLSTGYIYSRAALIEHDIIGVQLGGALKAVYALIMGVVEGYFKEKLGGDVDNTLFHISNRFFKEMVSIGVELGGKPETFQGLSGLSDFMLSCFGTDSHDRQLGYEFALGKAPEKNTSGSFGLKMLPNLIRLGIEKYPVVTAAYEVFVNGKDMDTMIETVQEKLIRV